MSVGHALLAKLIEKQMKKIQVKVMEDIQVHGKPTNPEEAAAMAERVTGKKVDPAKLDAIMAYLTKGKR